MNTIEALSKFIRDHPKAYRIGICLGLIADAYMLYPAIQPRIDDALHPKDTYHVTANSGGDAFGLQVEQVIKVRRGDPPPTCDEVFNITQWGNGQSKTVEATCRVEKLNK